MTIDRIADVETLSALADTGSFSQAGRVLGISQSSVSRRIGALEARLGGRQLVSRTTRTVYLTESGRVYLKFAKMALDQLYLAEQHMLDSEHELAGTLRLSLPPAIGRAALLPSIDGLLRDYPKLKVEVDFSERYVDFFDDQIDLAVRIRRTTQTGIEEVEVGETTIVLVASSEYLERTPLDPLNGFRQLRMIAPHQQHNRSFDRALERLGIQAEQIQIRVDDVSAVEQLVRQGFGVGFLPKLIVQQALLDGSMQEIDPGRVAPPIKFYATYPFEFRSNRRVNLLITRMQEGMARLHNA